MRKIVSVASVLALTACAQAAGNAPRLQGPPVKTVKTPYALQLECFKQELPTDRVLQIGIGQVKDSTGKYNLDEGSGYWVTQGATDILYSSFHREDAQQVVERADTRILEWEIDKANNRLLGDREPRRVRTADGDARTVRYRGIREGNVLGSDYYVIGSVNRLDLTTQSGEVEARIAGIGPELRGFSMSVGLDLRAVNTETGVVESVTSIDKEVIGHSYGFGIGRIFGTTLVEFGAEVKQVEPLHVVLKAMLQQATVDLLSDIYGVEPSDSCRSPVRKLEQEHGLDGATS